MPNLGGGVAPWRVQDQVDNTPVATFGDWASPGANFRPLPVPHATPILALDVATKMGWALRTAVGVTSGVANWAERKGESRGDRLYRFHRWLGAMNACRLGLVVHELVQGPGRGFAQHCYAQFEGVLLAWAARHGIPVRSVPSMTLKKAITGSGRADKGQMKLAVRKHGFTPDSDDEADAIAVMLWAMGVRA